jgi:hypothetical protein
MIGTTPITDHLIVINKSSTDPSGNYVTLLLRHNALVNVRSIKLIGFKATNARATAPPVAWLTIDFGRDNMVTTSTNATGAYNSIPLSMPYSADPNDVESQLQVPITVFKNINGTGHVDSTIRVRLTTTPGGNTEVTYDNLYLWLMADLGQSLDNL